MIPKRLTFCIGLFSMAVSTAVFAADVDGFLPQEDKSLLDGSSPSVSAPGSTNTQEDTLPRYSYLARHGSAFAQYRLAQLMLQETEQGELWIEALAWALLASESGLKEAVHFKDVLWRELDHEERSSVEQKVVQLKDSQLSETSVIALPKTLSLSQ